MKAPRQQPAGHAAPRDDGAVQPRGGGDVRRVQERLHQPECGPAAGPDADSTSRFSRARCPAANSGNRQVVVGRLRTVSDQLSRARDALGRAARLAVLRRAESPQGREEARSEIAGTADSSGAPACRAATVASGMNAPELPHRRAPAIAEGRRAQPSSTAIMARSRCPARSGAPAPWAGPVDRTARTGTCTPTPVGRARCWRT